VAGDGLVEYTFGRLVVVAFFADVAGWESYVDSWSVRFRDLLKVKANTVALGRSG
jgi:hypothetical protein